MPVADGSAEIEPPSARLFDGSGFLCNVKSVMIMLRKLVSITVFGALVSLTITACEPSPSYLDRWENRPGSEEKFIGYLQDPETSTEVKVRALELLVKQWQHSSSMMRNGEPLTALEPELRAEIVKAAMPKLQEFYEQDEATRVRTRDAIYHISKAIQDEETLNELRGIIQQWLEEQWEPCRQVGAVTISDLFRMVGEDAGKPIILSHIREGGYEEVVCTLQSTAGVEWRNQNEDIAVAVKDKWEEGKLPEETQARITFLDEFAPFASLEPIKVWLFEQLRNEDAQPVYKNYFVELLTNNRTEEDIARYVELLELEQSNYRWMGVKALVDIENAAGLDRALNNLPAEGDYAFFDGARRYDGFRRSSNVVCSLERLEEIEEQARDVLEKHIDDENIHSRVIAIDCLGKFGDSESVELLQEAKGNISYRENVEVPYWTTQDEDPVKLHDLIDTSIEEIQTPDEEEEADDSGDE